MEETACAKLNLALHVRSRGADGYHDIETIFAFTEAADRLSAAESDSLALRIGGPFAGDIEANDDNLVLKAARLLRERSGIVDGALLRLQKNLPVAAGIGGGSADAAAALRLLNAFWNLDLPTDTLLEMAKELGSDVPACLLSRAARGEGRGERLTLFGDWPLAGANVLLVNPRQPLSTAEVFRAWDGLDRGPLGDILSGRNDLEAPARSLVPAIGTVLQALAATSGASLVRMSGSGATCFALYEDEGARDEACRTIVSQHPQWWVLGSRLCSE